VSALFYTRKPGNRQRRVTRYHENHHLGDPNETRNKNDLGNEHDQDRRCPDRLRPDSPYFASLRALMYSFTLFRSSESLMPGRVFSRTSRDLSYWRAFMRAMPRLTFTLTSLGVRARAV